MGTKGKERAVFAINMMIYSTTLLPYHDSCCWNHILADLLIRLPKYPTRPRWPLADATKSPLQINAAVRRPLISRLGPKPPVRRLHFPLSADGGMGTFHAKLGPERKQPGDASASQVSA